MMERYLRVPFLTKEMGTQSAGERAAADCLFASAGSTKMVAAQRLVMEKRSGVQEKISVYSLQQIWCMKEMLKRELNRELKMSAYVLKLNVETLLEQTKKDAHVMK